MRGNTKNKSESVQEEIEKCFVIMPISDQGDYPKGHFTKYTNRFLNQLLKMPNMSLIGWMKIKLVILLLIRYLMQFRIALWHCVI